MRNYRNILIVGSSQGVFGGIEVFMLALGEFLNAQPGISCRVVFKIVKGYKVQTSLEELVAQSSVPAEIVDRGKWQLMRNLIWADVIHMQNFPPDALFPALLMGKSVVSTQHNWKRKKLNLHQILWNLAHLTTHYITYNSGFVARTWEHGKTQSHRSGVIPTVSRFLDEAPNYSILRKGFCFISRWIPNKGADLLIKAYSRTKLNRQDHPLRMMGSGPMLESLQKELETNPVEGVEILGRVSEVKKFEVIKSSRWMVTPPECFEDMGLTPIEGRMLGVPTVASNIGGVPESAGPYALFFESGDVDGLARQLEVAAKMEEDTYLEHAKGCHSSLSSYIRPMEIYLSIYDQIS